MKFVGIDLHKRYSMVTEMDGKGKTLRQMRLNNDPETLTHYLHGLQPNAKIGLEATANWYYFYELIEERHPNLVLSHPLKTRAIASARIKTDKIDSATLAHLLRADLLPASYIPPREVRDTRETLRYRASLVSLRTRLKNKVHAILSKNGLDPRVSDVFGKKGLRYLKSIKVRSCYRQALDGYLQLVESLNQVIQEVTRTIEEKVKSSPKAQLLMTLPGISYYSALLILSEIGEIGRFPSAGHLCSYGGLVPSVHSSGGKTRYGRITKQGSSWIRWILVEVSHHAVNGSTRFRALYHRVSKKHGKNAARVAVARKMLKVIYFMLRKNEGFRDYPIPKPKNTGHLRGVMTRKRS